MTANHFHLVFTLANIRQRCSEACWRPGGSIRLCPRPLQAEDAPSTRVCSLVGTCAQNVCAVSVSRSACVSIPGGQMPEGSAASVYIRLSLRMCASVCVCMTACTSVCVPEYCVCAHTWAYGSICLCDVCLHVCVYIEGMCWVLALCARGFNPLGYF